MDEEQGGGAARTRAPRPFPAIDPEPASRYTWRTARRAGIALAAACAVAVAAWAGVRLTGKPATPAPQFYARRSWLIPTGGGKAKPFGWVTATGGDPASGAAIASRLASDPAKARQVTCDAFDGPDRSLDLVAPGKPPATLVTAAA